MDIKKSTAIFLALTIATLTACQSLQDVAQSQRFSEPDGVTLMTEAQLRKILVGNTFGGNTVKPPGDQYLEFVRPDGTIHGLWNGKSRYDGEWAIHGKVWCYQSDKGKGCNTLSASGNTIYWYNLDGSTDGRKSRVYSGNPRQL